MLARAPTTIKNNKAKLAEKVNVNSQQLRGLKKGKKGKKGKSPKIPKSPKSSGLSTIFLQVFPTSDCSGDAAEGEASVMGICSKGITDEGM
jgi:hypothetical protein